MVPLLNTQLQQYNKTVFVAYYAHAAVLITIACQTGVRVVCDVICPHRVPDHIWALTPSPRSLI